MHESSQQPGVHMPMHGRRQRRGLTLLEFLIASTITVFISAAVASMLSAAARGMEYEQITRDAVVRAQALHVRLASYVTPSLNVLDAGNTSLVLWLDDTREGQTVHLSEIRWIEYDAVAQMIYLHHVQFPEEWTQIEKDAFDVECPSATDWWALLLSMQDLGYTRAIKMCDRLLTFKVDHDAVTNPQLVTFTISFLPDENGGETFVAGTGIREYLEPVL